jgi:hypothetical protein
MSATGSSRRRILQGRRVCGLLDENDQANTYAHSTPNGVVGEEIVVTFRHMRRWPWFNLVCSALAGFGSFAILLGSQPFIANRTGRHGWFHHQVADSTCTGIHLFRHPPMLRDSCWRLRKRSFTVYGTGPVNFPGGRHSLETSFPRRAAARSRARYPEALERPAVDRRRSQLLKHRRLADCELKSD